LSKQPFAWRLFDNIADAKKQIGLFLDYQASALKNSVIDEQALKRIEERVKALKNLGFFTKMEPSLDQKSKETLKASI
jgi:hypothetical protein